MINKKIVVIGSALRDIIMVTDSGKVVDNNRDLECKKLLGFELGAKTSIIKFLNIIGGSACNVAAGLKKMKVDPYPYIEVGDDIIGQRIKEDLNEMKISTKLLRIDRFKQTGFSFIVIDNLSREHVAFCRKEASEEIKINIKKIKIINPGWLYIGSLGESSEKEFAKIIDLKKDFKKLKIAVNPGINQITNKNKELRKMLAVSDLLILNRDEAISMAMHSDSASRFDIPERGLAQARFLLEESKNWRAGKVAITDGEDGVYLRDGKELYYAKSVPPVKLSDTTGAGDAFASGFLAGLIRGIDIKDCLKIGILNGSAVVERLGAQNGLLSWDRAKKMIEEAEVKRI